MRLDRPKRVVRFVRDVEPPCGFSPPIPGGSLRPVWKEWRGREITVFSNPLPNRGRCDSAAVWEITPQTRYRMRLPKIQGGYYVVCRHQIVFPRKHS